ncbi:MAG: hypothetical protein V1704_04290 [Candidatus Vogelbacteria bacterium]
MEIMTIIKAKFIKKYWFNIVKANDGFAIMNTQRKQNMRDRDGIGHMIHFCKTLQEAENYLEKYEKGNYAM